MIGFGWVGMESSRRAKKAVLQEYLNSFINFFPNFWQLSKAWRFPVTQLPSNIKNCLNHGELSSIIENCLQTSKKMCSVPIIMYSFQPSECTFRVWLWKSRVKQITKSFSCNEKLSLKLDRFGRFVCCRTISFIPATIARSDESIFTDCFPPRWTASRMKVCFIHSLWRLDTRAT